MIVAQRLENLRRHAHSRTPGNDGLPFVRSGIISSAQRFSRALREKMKWKNYFMMHVMMKILKQNDTQSAIAHHTPPQHSDDSSEDGKEEVEKPLVSYCKELSDLRVVAFTTWKPTRSTDTLTRDDGRRVAPKNWKTAPTQAPALGFARFCWEKKIFIFSFFFRFVVFFSLCSQFNL